MSKNEKLPENIKLEMIGEKRYVRINEGAKRYSVSPNTFRMMATEAHAIIHVRRIVLIDTKMIDEYLEAFREEQSMKFNYIYGKQVEQYDYLYIPKAFMKEESFKTMTASAKIMYVVLMEKQQKSVEMGQIDEKDHAYILVNIVAIGTELNWDETEVLAAVEELERFGLVEIAEKSEDIKLYLKRFV